MKKEILFSLLALSLASSCAQKDEKQEQDSRHKQQATADLEKAKQLRKEAENTPLPPPTKAEIEQMLVTQEKLRKTLEKSKKVAKNQEEVKQIDGMLMSCDSTILACKEKLKQF